MRSEPGDVDAHGNLAARYFERGELARALDEFAVAARPEPENMRVRNNLVACRIELGELEPALGEVRAILAASPDDLRALRAQGECLLALCRRVEARAALTRAAARHPGGAELARLLESARD